MKNLYLLILIVLIGCNDSKHNINDASKPDNSNKMAEIHYEKKFFDYDEIDYYRIDIPEDSESDLYENMNKSKTDKLKYEVIVNETPNNINDQDFLNYMEDIGYSKKTINPLNFERLNKIFSEKPEEEMTVAKCIPIFRDILIFSKNKKISGMMKICFDCHQYRILGTNAKTENFGTDNDYSQLWKILNEN